MIPIEVDRVSVAYNGTRVLEDLSLRIEGGRWLGIIGPNGAGKTTLLRSIMGLASFTGSISLGERKIGTLDRRTLAQLVAYVPQQPFVPRATTVTDYVLMGRTPYISYFGVESATDIEIVRNVLTRLELLDLAERALGSLSGGEFQRAVLARALAQQAPILLLDEPTSALDIGHQQQVLELVDSLRKEHQLTVVASMHDLTLAAQFSDELVLLNHGKKIVSGDARSVLTEDAIRVHFGADVRVLDDPLGGLLIVPRRSQDAELIGEPAP